MESKKLLHEINSAEAPTQEELKTYWNFIRMVLRFTKIFTGAKADALIDNIIAWGDKETQPKD